MNTICEKINPLNLVINGFKNSRVRVNKSIAQLLFKIIKDFGYSKHTLIINPNSEYIILNISSFAIILNSCKDSFNTDEMKLSKTSSTILKYKKNSSDVTNSSDNTKDSQIKFLVKKLIINGISYHPNISIIKLKNIVSDIVDMNILIEYNKD